MTSIDTKITLSGDQRSANIAIQSARGKYETRITGEEHLWMVRMKALPGGLAVHYVNNTDGTLSDIRIETYKR